jgi:hypothetical protein
MRLAHANPIRFVTALLCTLLLLFPSVAIAATPPVGAPERADPPSPPGFDVDPNQDAVWGNGWTADGAVDVVIGNLQAPVFTTSALTDSSGNFNTMGSIGYDVVAGQTVTVSDGASTRSTVITAVAVSAADPPADTVSGTAAPGSVLQVGFDGPEYYSIQVTADGGGNWVADFAGHRDMVPGSQGNVRQDDGDGDGTHIRWRAANPHFKVKPDEDAIWGHDWVFGGSQVEIGITHQSVTTTFLADIDGGANFDTGGLGYDIQPGDSILVTDGTTAKTHMVTALDVTTIDTTFDTIGGTAAPGTEVWVDVVGTNRARRVTANGSGYWLANFGAPAGEEDWQQTWDIKLGDNGHAEQSDEDADVTWIGWRVRAPAFRVSAQGNGLWGHDWLPGGQLAIKFGNPASPDYQTTVMADGSGSFNTQIIDYDIQVGDLVTVSDAEKTKSHTVTNLTVTVLDVDADIVGGTALPNAPVFVNLNAPDGGRFRNVVADGSGNWSADFSVAAGSQPQDQIWDLTPGDNGGVDEYDADGDGTSVGFHVSNPWFRIAPWNDSLWGGEWLPNAELSITVGDPSSPEYSTTVQTDGGGNFDTSGSIPYDVQAGDLITMTDGASSKAHVCTALTVVIVDAETDTVMGAAAPGAGVSVYVNAPDGGRNRYVSAGLDGTWVADFSVAVGSQPQDQSWDLVPGDQGGAEEFDDDGDATHAPWQIDNPTFTVDPAQDSIWGWQWAPETEVGIRIGSALSPDFAGAVLTDEWGNFGLSGIGYDIQPGETVTVTNGTTVKEHVVFSVTVTGVDVDTDRVHGTADPYSTVWVNTDMVWRSRQVEADENGNWSADFGTAEGDQEWQQSWDLTLGSSGTASQNDADGDSTQASWRIPNPGFTVSTQDDNLWGWDWAPDSQVTITIGEVGNPDLEMTADVSEWGDFGTEPVGYDVQVGDIVTVSDGVSTKTHVVLSLTITDVDSETDTVSGTAGAGSAVLVDVGEWSSQREVVADDFGDWTADFSVAGPGDNEQQYDIAPGTSVGAHEFDDDGDATWFGMRIPNPGFSVSPADDSLWGWEWTADSLVTITIGDVGDPIFEMTAGTDEWGNFGTDPVGFDILPGMVVTVTDGVITKTHIVTSLILAAVDIAADTVSGTAEPRSSVWVDVNTDWGDGSGREVVADDFGDWTADFSVAGPEEWQQPFDIGPGVQVGASQSDEDGDSTWAGMRIPNPGFSVRPADDSVWGWEWTPSSLVTITIGDVGDPIFEMTAGTDEWGNFGTDPVGFDILPGMLVTITDGVSTKTHIVTSLTVGDVDVDADTVSGTAEPGSALWVDVNGGESGRQVTADGEGNWVADFSVAGGEDWQQPFDIGPGAEVGASQSDADGDSTWAGRHIPNPQFRVNPEWNDIWGFEFLANAEITIVVGELLAPDFTTSVVANESGEFSMNTMLGYDIGFGDVITVSDGVTTKTHVVRSFTVSGVDYDADTVYGTAEPGSWVGVTPSMDWFGMPYQVMADEATGEWVADFSDFYDIVHGSTGSAEQFDDDWDATSLNWIANAPPVPVADQYSTPQGTLLSVDAPGVLANDSDADGDDLIAEKATDPAHGIATMAADGSFTYQPDAGFTGIDTFSYYAYDGAAWAWPVEVTIDVQAPVGTFVLEHDAAGVIFDRFVSGYSTAYSGGGYVYGRWTGTVLKASFTGSSIKWVGPKQPGYGMADVWIDGTKVASDVDCYAPDAEKTLSATIWESATLTDGPHTIELKLVGHKNAASPGFVVVLDRFELAGTAPSGLGTRYDDSTAAPGYTGTWLPYINPTYVNKTYAYSRWTNAAFTLAFTGTQVSWIGPRTPNYGMADVYIDSVKVATVDTYRANLATQGWREVVWTSNVLTPGAHTLSIRPLGTKNPAATAANVVVDAIDVRP